MKKKTALYLALAAVLVALDQGVKYWVRTTIPVGAKLSFLPGVVELTYVKNTGAAFSMLSSYTWLLSLISAVVAVVLVVLLLRRSFPPPLGELSLALILGGAVGNLIDRVFLGFVVDMFNLQFMNFAVFNVADIGVTVGGVLLCIYVLFCYQDKKEEKA